MAILGAHMSIAGGLHRAVQRAAGCGCLCLQVFSKNSNQWQAPEITPDQATRFREALVLAQIGFPVIHDSYLINLASPEETLWKRSVDAMVVECQRAELLGIPYVITHPGAYTSSSEAQGLRRIARALDEVHRQTRRLRVKCLLETTAGQGTSLGWRFEHLGALLDGVQDPERLGVCFDTCHVFAAGYRLETEKAYRATMRQFDRLVGLEQIRAFHLNDSVRPCGSRVDRHAHIGRGCLGRQAFGYLLADPRFQDVPMYLETPKGEEDGVDLDRVNLAVLRELAALTRV